MILAICSNKNQPEYRSQEMWLPRSKVHHDSNEQVRLMTTGVSCRSLRHQQNKPRKKLRTISGGDRVSASIKGNVKCTIE